MSQSLREFDAGPDPFGNRWGVRFAWLQTAIAIRHADTIDVKFLLSSGGRQMEKVIALPHPHLLTLSERHSRPVTDPWCMTLAAQHVRRMIETGEDFEKTVVTVPFEKLEGYAGALDRPTAAR